MELDKIMGRNVAYVAVALHGFNADTVSSSRIVVDSVRVVGAHYEACVGGPAQILCDRVALVHILTMNH